MPLVSFQNTVGGRLQSNADTFESYDPFTGKPWALIPRGGKAEVDAAVASAKAAFRSKDWAGITPTARGKLLVRDRITAGAGISTSRPGADRSAVPPPRTGSRAAPP